MTVKDVCRNVSCQKEMPCLKKRLKGHQNLMISDLVSRFAGTWRRIVLRDRKNVCSPNAVSPDYATDGFIFYLSLSSEQDFLCNPGDSERIPKKDFEDPSL